MTTFKQTNESITDEKNMPMYTMFFQKEIFCCRLS